MRRISWLDQIVYRFQHQWETNPQYRAAATGVVGLVVIITMCGAMGVLSATANSALAAIGIGGASNAPTGTPNTGTRGVNGYLHFNTPVVTYPPQTPPAVATIPQSQTPLPGPTATDTPSPTDTPTGGGNYACSGSSKHGTLSYAVSPCPATHGQYVTITINGPSYGNDQVDITINLGSCGDCTWLYQPSQFSGGSWSLTKQVPADDTGSTLPITIQVHPMNSQEYATFFAPPVQ